MEVAPSSGARFFISEKPTRDFSGAQSSGAVRNVTCRKFWQLRELVECKFRRRSISLRFDLYQRPTIKMENSIAVERNEDNQNPMLLTIEHIGMAV